MGSERSLAELQAAVEALDAEFVCGGTWRGRQPLALVLPSGERIAMEKRGGPQRFVDALLKHSEPAPFGDGRRNRTDPDVRRAMRVLGRDAIVVEGFDPVTSGVLAIVERELSPYGSLTASLTDVVIYPEGGHFVAHKDTPRSDRMLGTLVVGLPIPHEGGALELRRGEFEVALDWANASPDPLTVSWGAFYGDVDHRVLPVTSGARVTLTYQVNVAGERSTPTDTPDAASRREALGRALEQALASKGDRLFIPCAHMVIAGKREKAGEPIPITSLRGRDRHLAALLLDLDLELQIAVRPCLAIANDDEFHSQDAERMTLDRRIPPKSKEVLGGWVILEGDASFDELEAPDVFSLARFGPESIAEGDYVTRDAVHAEFLAHTAGYSSTGYFGNESSEAYFYAFAAIEVSTPGAPEEPLAPPAAEKRVAHPKFGEGVVTGERVADGKTVLEIRFEDGSTRKLDAAFVKRLT